ncbi:Regulator of chromosome condensation (RCC1) repeat [uncultured Caudovirales phage]|uniref:Regulator of chromosome condensation (RCC1) repeat n=1 Tax=uncultured Caudovirales phage TaxID=2100421 RepID=A0A6J5KNY1_9CAUD|nr:Regulator of chromosome condensation (RCC1) repeat [uncultured Caudovirales phage]
MQEPLPNKCNPRSHNVKTGIQRPSDSNVSVLVDIGDPYPGREEILQYWGYINPAFEVPALKSWGGDNYGQLGTNSISNVSTPVSVGALTNWREVSAGGLHVAAVKTNGTAWCWGDNDYGQLGNNDTSYLNRSSPVQVGVLTNWQQISAGWTHTVAVKTDGTLWAWGSNWYGQLGVTLPTKTLVNNYTAGTYGLTVPRDWSSVNTVGVVGGGGGGSWGGVLLPGGFGTSYPFPGDGGGGGAYAQQNNITLTPQSSISYTVGAGGAGGYAPASNSYGDTNARGLAGGNSVFGGVSGGGGGGSLRTMASPIPTPGSAGTGSGGAINQSGDAGGSYVSPDTGGIGGMAGTRNALSGGSGGYSTGAGGNGTQGGGGGGGGYAYAAGGNGGSGGSGFVVVTYTPSLTVSPVQVGSATNWQQVSAGGYHTLALDNTGSLWAWGLNTSGQLGDTTTVQKSSPVPISGPESFYVAISAGALHSLAISTTGKLYAWGLNSSGQVGASTGPVYAYATSPILVGSATNWRSISAHGSYSSAAINTNSQVYTWGSNNNGQLGLGDTVNRSSPVQIGTKNIWSSIAMGLLNSAAITTDGSLWAWGYNTNGELGIGNTVNKSSPAHVGSLTNWKSVSVGGNQTGILTTVGGASITAQGFSISIVSATDF